MENTRESLLSEYESKVALFNVFGGKCQSLLYDLLRINDIRVHSVTCRIKDRNSLSAKLSQIGKECQNLSQVTDVVGIRIITYLEDEVDIVGRMLESEFTIDQKNSVDKRKALDPDRFGYLSLHYVCCISNERLKLPEYRRFKDLFVEIQVRSILQHAWAEIEHDLGYKAGSEIPAPIRRRFSRLAGLLELADSEFSRLNTELNNYTETVKSAIIQSPSEIELDNISLTRFIETDPVSTELDSHMASYVKAKLIPRKHVGDLVQVLRFAGIKTIADLRQSLAKHKDIVQAQWEERLHGQRESILQRGIGLFHLFQVLVALGGGVKCLKEAFEQFRIGGPKDEADKRIVGTIQRLAKNHS